MIAKFVQLCCGARALLTRQESDNLNAKGGVQMSDIVIFVEDGYEEFELWVPYYRFLESGYTVTVAGNKADRVYAGKHGIEAKSDTAFSAINLAGVRALLIPGGHAPDRLRMYDTAVELVRNADNAGIVIAAICHAGSVLVSAGIVAGRRLTSYRSIRDDLIAAGANWVDEPVVVDRNLITARTPRDLPQFLPAILHAITK